VIAVGVAGCLSFIAIICVAITRYRSSTRKIESSPFENAIVHGIPYSTKVDAATAQKPPLNAQERPPSLYQPPNVFPLPPSIVPPDRVISLDRREDPDISQGVRGVDERLTWPVDDLGQSPSDPPPQGQHTSKAHSPANHLASANPALRHIRRSSARRPLSQVEVHNEVVYTTRRGTDEEEAVSEEHAVGPPRWLGIGARVGRSSPMPQIQERVIPPTYFTHTDAGEVRVVELPPPYNELQWQSTHRT